MYISEVLRDNLPECLVIENPVPEKRMFNIGFININPGIENFQGDGIANDETCFFAATLEEISDLFDYFCKENNLPTDTVVTYIEVAKQKFTVDYMVRGHAYYEVEAETKEEAVKLAEKLWAEDSFGSLKDADYSQAYSITDESGEVEYLG